MPFFSNTSAVALDDALHLGDALDLRDLVLQALGDRRAVLLVRAARAGVGLERLLGAHDGVDALVRVGEQRVEDVAQRVGEHERPGHERDAEHDGQRRERQPELLGQRPLIVTRNTDQPPSCFILSRTASAVGRSHLVDDLAVGQEHDPVGVARGAGVVRDHHDRLPEVADRAAHELEDLGAGT